MSKRLYVRLSVAALILVLSIRIAAQTDAPDPNLGTIVGTVMDVHGDTVPGATVDLQGADANDTGQLVTHEDGFFQFRLIKPGVPYHVRIAAKNFAEWASPAITIHPGQFKIVTDIQLRVATEQTTVQVTYNPVEVATEQLKEEETQRVFGIVPNFYVSYEKDPAPLTPKMKFQLALRVATDPVTAAGVALVSASKQAANSPSYGQGWAAYGKRVGATATDGFSDIMIGGAILPSLLHQDPRYFYQGTGTTGSRIRHALFSPFIARGDNGKWQPNYSSIGGDLASSGLANLYYPRSDRGVGLVFSNFAIGTAERMGASLAQEFIIGKITRRSGHMKERQSR